MGLTKKAKVVSVQIKDRGSKASLRYHVTATVASQKKPKLLLRCESFAEAVAGAERILKVFKAAKI